MGTIEQFFSMAMVGDNPAIVPVFDPTQPGTIAAALFDKLDYAMLKQGVTEYDLSGPAWVECSDLNHPYRWAWLVCAIGG
mgnify:FL=1